jgi:DNA adenine methylase
VVANTSDPRPFLKWAGGKRQLLPHLRHFYPDRVGHYFEPFLGSAAVFFDLWTRGRITNRATLSDDNGDLIGCYLRVRDATEAVVGHLRELAAGHASGGRDHFYEVRDQRFNPDRRRWFEAGGVAANYPADLAAMLIYLNRTGYNGLFRLNARGEFNVPAGRYDSPRVLDPARITAAARVLADPRVEIVQAPFDAIGDRPNAGDLVYLDPPYAPMSVTAHFRSYTARGFSDGDQTRLQELAIAMARRGALVLLSNSTASSVTRLYEDDRTANGAGLRAYRIPARRAINSRADRRGVIEELLVTNLPRQ